MVVSDLDCAVVTFPVVSPQRMGVGQLNESTSNVFLRLKTDGGIEGFGEVPVWNVTIDFTIEQIVSEVERLARQLYQMDVAMLLQGFGKSPATIPSVAAALEMCLVDAVGKGRGLPAYDVLGGMRTPGIALSYSVSLQDADKEIPILQGCFEEGYRIFKVKVGVLDADADLDRMEKLVSAIPGATFRVDFNQTARGNGFASLLAGLQRLGVTYVEQPFRVGQDHILVEHVNADVAFVADESFKDQADFDRLVPLNAYRIYSLKLAKVGGFTAARRLLKQLGEQNLKGYAGGMSESVFGVTAAVHFFCGCQHLVPGCDFYFPFRILGEQHIEGVRPRMGYLFPPNVPGIGAVCPRNWFH